MTETPEDGTGRNLIGFGGKGQEGAGRYGSPDRDLEGDCYCDWRGFDRTDTANGNSLGALFYYTSVVYSVFVI